jgi:hypothetical protein
LGDADISTLAPTLIGAAHLLFTDADGIPEHRRRRTGRRRGPGRWQLATSRR